MFCWYSCRTSVLNPGTDQQGEMLNALVVDVDDLFAVIHTAVTDLDVLRLNILPRLRSLGKCLSIRLRNCVDVGVDVHAQWRPG